MRSTLSKRSVASLSFLAIATSAVLISGGCATPGPIAVDSTGERAANARTESDHRELASAYERQAGVDKDLSEKHGRLALTYAKSWSPVAPWSHGTGRGPIGNPAAVRHCENLANLYAQASAANLELAAAHRQASGGTMK